MDFLVVVIFWLATMVWYVRPIYNFLARRKYLLLDVKSLSFFRRVQTWLPALLFFIVLFGLMFVPALTNQIINAFEFGSIFVLQVLFIFVLTRFDKFQTKYRVYDEYIQFYNRRIYWDEPYTVEFKRTVFVLLHKPRVILRSKKTKIVVPMLSHNFEAFARTMLKNNVVIGEHIFKIYRNARAYYVDTIEVVSELNELGKKTG